MQGLPSENFALVDCIDPDAYATGAQNGTFVDASKFHAYMGVVMVGDIGAGNTMNFKLTQAQDSGGTGEKDISGAAITAISQSTSPETSDVQAIVNVRTEDLDRDNGFDFIRIVMTPGSTTSPLTATDCGAVLFGYMPRHGPASDNDASSVAEIVTA